MIGIMTEVKTRMKNVSHYLSKFQVDNMYNNYLLQELSWYDIIYVLISIKQIRAIL